MRTALALAAMLTGAASIPAIADDAFLSRLVGEWTGRGEWRTTPDSEPERIYCKIANTIVGDGRSLQQKGRCSLASNSGPIDGTISAIGSNLYGGSLNSLASKGPATIAGSASGSRLELNADFVDTINGKPARSVIVIDLTAGGYRLTSIRIDPDTGARYTASQIVFSN